MLEFMADEKVFNVELFEGKTILSVTEACDNHFSVDLNKRQLVELIADLQALVNQMVGVLFEYEEKVVLTSDYTDEFGHFYKKGQTGMIGNPIEEGDKCVILVLDGYEESKKRAEEMWKKDGEGPNVVEYLTEIPISLLERIERIE